MHFIVGYLSTFSDYFKIVFENYKKNVCFFYTGAGSK